MPSDTQSLPGDTGSDVSEHKSAQEDGGFDRIQRNSNEEEVGPFDGTLPALSVMNKLHQQPYDGMGSRSRPFVAHSYSFHVFFTL